MYISCVVREGSVGLEANISAEASHRLPLPWGPERRNYTMPYNTHSTTACVLPAAGKECDIR